MIQVVTTVQLKPGCLGDFLLALNETVPKVKAEQGCLSYDPLIDVDAGLRTQIALRKNTITLVEAWETMDALRAHLGAPHMASFREAAEPYVQGFSHQVLQPAL